MQVGQRHFRGRNQIEIPVAGDLEEVLLELRQVAGAAQRRRIDEERRLDLGVAVLARVQVEHEVDERARQPRARAHQHREPGAATSASRARSRGCRAPAPRSQCGFGSKSKAGGSPCRRTSWLSSAVRADGNAGVRQVRQRQQQRRALVLGLIELDLELADVLPARLVRGKERRGVLPLPLGARDFVAGGVLLPLEALDLRDQPPAARLERRQLLEIRVGIEAAVLQAGADLVEVIAHESGVEHASKS